MYKSKNGDAYVVFGDYKIDDMSAGAQAQAQFAQQMSKASQGAIAEDDDEIPELEEASTEEVDDSGLDAQVHKIVFGRQYLLCVFLLDHRASIGTNVLHLHFLSFASLSLSLNRILKWSCNKPVLTAPKPSKLLKKTTRMSSMLSWYVMTSLVVCIPFLDIKRENL